MASKFAAGLAVLLVGAGAVVAAPWAATAAPPQSPAHAGTRSVVRQGLHFVGFDRRVAAAHGYKIITLANGTEESVPKAAWNRLLPSTDGALPNLLPGDGGSSNFQDTVWGDCGYSYIEGFITGRNQIELNSGFGLASYELPVVIVKWTISLKDANGISHQTYSGGILPSRSWNRWWTNLYQHMYSIDEVVTTSEVIQTNGAVCSSVGPIISVKPIPQ